jgi:hypothetical protein
MFGDMSLMEIIKLLAPLIVVEFGLKIFCLVRLAKDKVKYLPKWAWVLIILFINTFGPLVFILVGRVKD